MSSEKPVPATNSALPFWTEYLAPGHEVRVFEINRRNSATRYGVYVLEEEVEAMEKRINVLQRVLEDEYGGVCPHCSRRKGKSNPTCGRHQCLKAEHFAERRREGHMLF